MRPAAGIAAAVGALAVAGALAWFAVGGTEDPVAEGPPTRSGPEDGESPRPPDAPPSKERPKGSDRPAPPPPREEKIPPPPPLSDEPVPGAGLAFAFTGYEEALGAIDWHRVGVAARKALEASRDAARDIPRGIDADARTDGVQRATEEILVLAQPLFPAMLRTRPEGRPEAVAEEPAFVANAIVAALRAFHRPLTDAQVESLRAATGKALAAEAEHAGPPGEPPSPPASAAEGTLALAVARTERLRAFRDGVSALLDEPQRRVIFPESVRDRAGLDLFGPAFGWTRRVERVPVPAEARWSEVALGRVIGPAGPAPAQLPKLRAAVEAWFAAPGEKRVVPLGGEVSRRGFPTLEESLAAARATISLLDHVAREGGLRPEQVARLLSFDVAVALERVD